MFSLLSNKIVLDNKFNKKINNKIKKQKFKIKLDKINENEEINFNFQKNNLNEYNQYKIYDLNEYLNKLYNSIINFFKHHLNHYKND